jgi:hypothetical protein
MHTFYAADTFTHEILFVPLLGNSRDRLNALSSIDFYFHVCEHLIMQNIFSMGRYVICGRINVRE